MEALARQLLDRYGFREVRTPIFETTDLFARGVGASTDIVRKEMFTFVSGEDSLTLRPEMTASVVRAYIQHGLSRVPAAERLYYIGPMFRHERPQKGRQRQFHQLGVEVFGLDDPYVDAETIEMLISYLGQLGVRGLTLVINSVGCSGCRPEFRGALRDWLAEAEGDGAGPASSPRAARLCADCQRRLAENPLRVFDCKIESDRALLARAPTVLEHLCAACREHFEALQKHLGQLGIGFRIDPRLVRGLDYYVRTAFEIVADRGLGSQNALMGGGRYDGLLKELGGPDLPAFGWALGLERLVMLLGAFASEGDPLSIPARADLFLAHMGDDARGRAITLARELRGRGVSVRIDPRSRGLGAQLRRAEREGARFALILGDDEIRAGIYQLKDMERELQEPIEAADGAKLLDELVKRTLEPAPTNP